MDYDKINHKMFLDQRAEAVRKERELKNEELDDLIKTFRAENELRRNKLQEEKDKFFEKFRK